MGMRRRGLSSPPAGTSRALSRGSAFAYFITSPAGIAFIAKGVSTCLDHTLHVVVGPRTPSHELPVRHGIDLYGVLKQAVEQQSTRP